MSSVIANAQGLMPWKVWDRQSIAAGATSTLYNFFITPIGTSGKTKMDTNLTQVSRFPGSKSFNATHLYFQVNTTLTKPDCDALFDNYYWELWVLDRVFAEGHLWMAGAPGGVSGFSNDAGDQVYTNGVPTGTTYGFDLRLPAAYPSSDGLTGVYIGKDTNFSINLIGTSFVAAAAFKITACLEGVLFREVQP